MVLADRVSAAVVNYQTPDLTETAVRSFRRHFPDLPLLVIDNGSEDDSPRMIKDLAEELGADTLYLDENRYHGPAMDLAMHHLKTPFVFMLDSDTETINGGFLEWMLEPFDDPHLYGAGKIVHVDRRGFAAPEGIPVLVSAFMLLRREMYLALPPFIHHGLPALKNFEAAASRGWKLAPFDVEKYVKHFGRGTAERYGYGLGLKSRFDYLLKRLGF